jgi:DNA-directed RNA polymerases I, II, and III subunit RPABC3
LRVHVVDVGVQDLFNGVKGSEMDNFEYVMHGKVYKLDKRTEEGSTRAVVNVSFGGLLMQLVAEHNKLSRFDLDSMVYLLIRKAN